MPIYEFECDACGERFDRLQKLSDPDPSACPKCGASPIKRVLNAPAFRLAGGGWYETDFKKDGESKRNLAGKDEAAKSDAKPDASKKTEAKPDAKSAPAAPAAATSSGSASAGD